MYGIEYVRIKPPPPLISEERYGLTEQDSDEGRWVTESTFTLVAHASSRRPSGWAVAAVRLNVVRKLQ